MWFDHLPVDAVPGDTVRVVSIDRRGVDELRDHPRQESWKTAGQRLPVLENISPVACVVKSISSVVVAQDDGELVPRATRVTVAATEPQRQILKAAPLEVSRAVGLSLPRVVPRNSTVSGSAEKKLSCSVVTLRFKFRACLRKSSFR